MSTPEQRLPDPDLVEQAVISLVKIAPVNWVKIVYVIWYPDVIDDVIRARMWVDTPDAPEERVMPSQTTPRLLRGLRLKQVQAGQPAWRRADIHVEREPGSSEPTFKVDFSYEVGEIPD